jgi:hypothetical protein
MHLTAKVLRPKDEGCDHGDGGEPMEYAAEWVVVGVCGAHVVIPAKGPIVAALDAASVNMNPVVEASQFHRKIKTRLDGAVPDFHCGFGL